MHTRTCYICGVIFQECNGILQSLLKGCFIRIWCVLICGAVVRPQTPDLNLTSVPVPNIAPFVLLWKQIRPIVIDHLVVPVFWPWSTEVLHRPTRKARLVRVGCPPRWTPCRISRPTYSCGPCHSRLGTDLWWTCKMNVSQEHSRYKFDEGLYHYQSLMF